MEPTIIERLELKSILASSDVNVFMAMNDWAYQATHIVGTVPAESAEVIMATTPIDEPVVVYCSGPACTRSLVLARRLAQIGYRNVRRYVGGLEDWTDAGEPVAGLLSA